MPGASRIATALLGLGAVASVIGATVWWATADRSAFYTDGDAIRANIETSSPRDILWTPPEPFDAPVHTDRDEFDASFTIDGDTLYLARTTANGDADLFVSRRAGGEWSSPEPLDTLNTPDQELAPRPSPDGAWLYFASDRPGSAGGYDIYRAPLTDLGPGEPERLGEAINSPGDESWPTLTRDGASLIFASNTSGESFDLYESALDGEHWQAAHKLEDVSSPQDDIAPALSPAGDFLYFASDREGGAGAHDLYRFRLGAESPRRVDSLGPDVNTTASESDPAPTMDGFAIVFTTDRETESGAQLHRVVSREVELSRSTKYGDWSHILALIPWILLALALVLLLALLRRLFQDGVVSGGLATLGLMARCVLVSLVIHAALLALLSVLRMDSMIGDERGGTRVTLTSSSVAGAITAQLQGAGAEPTIDASTADLAPAEFEATLEPLAVEMAALPMERAAITTPTETFTTDAQPAESSVSPRAASSAPVDSSSDTPVEFAESLAADVATPEPDAPSAVTNADPRDTYSPTGALPATNDLPVPSASAGAPAELVELDLGEPASAAASASTSLYEDTAVADADLTAERSAPLATDALALDTPSGAEPFDDLPLPDIGAPGNLASEQAGEPGATIEDLLRDATDAGSSDTPFELAYEDASVSELTDLGLAPMPTDAAAGALVEDSNEIAETPEIAAPSLALVTDDLALPDYDDGITLDIDLPDPGQSLVIEFPDAPTLRGIVVDRDTREPVPGARVDLDREGAADLSAYTEPDGTFEITATSVPDQFAITATKRGYAPGSINVSGRDVEASRQVIIYLDPFNPYVLALEDDPRVHHLGNDEFSGRVNSQFQRRSEGTALTMGFTLDPANYDSPIVEARVTMLAKGVQLECPLFVNGRRLPYHLPESPSDGSFGDVSIDIPLPFLRAGANTFEIRTIKRRDTDIDDFEFVNVRIELTPQGDTL